MSNKWIARKVVLGKITLPALVWSKNAMLYVENPKGFLWDSKRNYDLGTYEAARIIVSNGICFQITNSKLGKFRLKSGWDLVGWNHKKWWPREIDVVLGEVKEVNFAEFKEEIISFVIEKKWYRRPNQGLSIKEQFESVEHAKKAKSFPELFKAVSLMMSLKYRRDLFGD